MCFCAGSIHVWIRRYLSLSVANCSRIRCFRSVREIQNMCVIAIAVKFTIELQIRIATAYREQIHRLRRNTPSNWPSTYSNMWHFIVAYSCGYVHAFMWNEFWIWATQSHSDLWHCHCARLFGVFRTNSRQCRYISKCRWEPFEAGPPGQCLTFAGTNNRDHFTSNTRLRRARTDKSYAVNIWNYDNGW